MLEKLKEIIFGESKRTTKETQITKEQKEEIPKYYRKQLAEKDAKVMDLQKQLQQMEERFDSLKEDAQEKERKRQEEREQRLGDKPFTDQREIDWGELLDYVRNGGKIQVLSREHMFMGWLHTIKMKPVGDKMTWHIITRNDEGKYFKVIDGMNLQNLIHRPTGLVDALDTGVLVINRSFFKSTPVPDSFITEYGKPKHIETVLQEKNEQMQQLRQRMEGAKKREQEERSRRKEDQLGKQVQKARADTMSKNLLSDVKDMTNVLKNYRQKDEDLMEQSERATSLKNKAQALQETVKDTFEHLEKTGSKDEVRKAKDELVEELDKLKDITGQSQTSEGEE